MFDKIVYFLTIFRIRVLKGVIAVYVRDDVLRDMLVKDCDVMIRRIKCFTEVNIK